MEQNVGRWPYAQRYEMSRPRSMWPEAPAPMVRPTGDLDHITKLRSVQAAEKVVSSLNAERQRFLAQTGKTVSGMARSAGLSRRGIQKNLSGTSMPRVDHFLDMCEVMEIKPSEFYAYLVQMQRLRKAPAEPSTTGALKSTMGPLGN